MTARKKYKGFTGNRYTWKGGESTGIRKSAKYINIRKEWEHYKDMGFDPVITIWDLLGFLDKQVSYDRMGPVPEPASADNATSPTLPSDYPPSGTAAPDMGTSDIGNDPMAEEGKIQLTYHGRPVDVWVNNVTDTAPADDYLCSDYRSLTMTEENIRTNSLTGRQPRGEGDYQDCFGRPVRFIIECDPQLLTRDEIYWARYWFIKSSRGISQVTQDNVSANYMVRDGVTLEELPPWLQTCVEDLFFKD